MFPAGRPLDPLAVGLSLGRPVRGDLSPGLAASREPITSRHLPSAVMAFLSLPDRYIVVFFPSSRHGWMTPLIPVIPPAEHPFHPLVVRGRLRGSMSSG